MGSAALRRELGAKIVAGAHSINRSVADLLLQDGETLHVGKLAITALSTPGHTPESYSYAVAMKEKGQICWGVFTGDALFVGETGRTDLPDPNKTAENAGLLFDAIHSKLLSLGDSVLLFPAHGAGSVCGGKIAPFDQSTIGFERTYNKVFTLSRPDFIQHKLHERLPRPPYFKLLEKLNTRGGLEMKPTWKLVPSLLPKDFEAESKGKGVVIDTRPVEAFAAGHIPVSFSVWLEGLPIFGGWVAPDNTPIYLVVQGEHDLKTALLHLARIGNDSVQAVLAGGFESWRDAGMPIEISATISPAQLQKLRMPVIDVRTISEYEDEGHIAKALHADVGYLPDHISDLLKKLSKEEAVAVTCSVGHRASLAASILSQQGFVRVHNLLGGMTAWNKLEMQTEKQAHSGAKEAGGGLIIDQKSIEKDFPFERQ